MSLNKNKFKNFLSNLDKLWVIHYTCSDFNEEAVMISSISLRLLKNDSVTTYAIKEKEDINESEKKLLLGFLEHTKNHPDAKYIHWNMYSDKYGFSAIQKRFKELFPTDNLQVPYPENELNLSSTLYEIYGNPKLHTLMKKNDLNTDDFMTGAIEATEFKSKNFYRIKLSCIRKVSNLAELVKLTHKKDLKTNFAMRNIVIITKLSIKELIAYSFKKMVSLIICV
jgi:hypothetical protein